MAPRRTFRVVLAYDGAAFAGFARQPGHRTVESAVQEELTSRGVDVRGFATGGRTDRGVHAVGQVISFHTRSDVSAAGVAAAIDQAPGLAVCEATLAPRWFHARYSAVFRRYAYFHETIDDDVARIDRMLGQLIGTRCMSAFARDTPKGASTVRTIVDARARLVPGDGTLAIRFDIAAQSFLRRQVRIMIATAVREARAGASDDRLVALAATGDRTATAPPADASGLYLVRVGYEPR